MSSRTVWRSGLRCSPTVRRIRCPKRGGGTGCSRGLHHLLSGQHHVSSDTSSQSDQPLDLPVGGSSLWQRDGRTAGLGPGPGRRRHDGGRGQCAVRTVLAGPPAQTTLKPSLLGMRAPAISATAARQRAWPQTCSQASPPRTTPIPPASSVPHSSQRRLVNRAMAAMAMAICNTVVAWAQRWW